jgi:hypothetical protein
VTYDPFLVCLPVADRPRAAAFYRDGLGLEAGGEPADDGVPEPLLLRLNAGAELMLIPTGGFGWGVGDHEVAAPGTSECILGIRAADEAGVDAVVARVRAAGAVIVAGPARQPWGYEATFTDPDGHVWNVTAAPAPA